MSNTTNTLNLTEVFSKGDVLISTINPDLSVEVVSPYMVTASWLPRNVRFATATKHVLDEAGLEATEFNPAEMWEDVDGVSVGQRFVEANIVAPSPTKKRKGKTGFQIPVTGKTLYSHLRSADDVVTTDIPEAHGYIAGQADMWKDYLSGGEGALQDDRLSNKLLNEGWVSVCCNAYAKEVAGVTLCKTCGGFFESAEMEGA